MKSKNVYLVFILLAAVCVAQYKPAEATANEIYRLSEDEIREKIGIALSGDGKESRKAAEALLDYYAFVTDDPFAAAAWRLRAVELGSKTKAEYIHKQIPPFETPTVENGQFYCQPALASKIRFSIPVSFVGK